MKLIQKTIIVFAIIVAGLLIYSKNVNASGLNKNFGTDPTKLNPTVNIGYTVTYDPNGGTVSPSSHLCRLTYEVLPTPVRTGYIFKGWYYDGKKVDKNSAFVIFKDHTLTAQWSPNSYTLMLNANGGICTQSSKTVVYSEKYGSLPVPTREGYNFEGWSLSKNENKYISSDSIFSIAGNQTVYAIWKAKTIQISLNANDGKCSVQKLSIKYNSSVRDLPIPTRSKYSFDGWYTAKNGGKRIENNSVCIFANNVTLYAHWKAVSKKNSGSSGNVSDKNNETLKTSQKTSTSTAKKKSSNLKKGKVFISWKRVRNATGYQVKLSASKKFTNCKIKTFGKSKSSGTFKNLQKGKKYYIKIRACGKSGKKNIYSKWSSAKIIKAK